MKAKMSLITLGVADLERSRKFYEALGFPTHNFDPSQGVVFFKLEGTWLSLFPRHELANDAGVPESGSGFCGFSIAHNEPSEADVDRVFQAAISAGARVVKSPQKVFWGGYSGYFSDPDGFLWEVAWNPHTDLT